MTRQETADDYKRVLAASSLWRVIRCRDDRQWIVQRRAAARSRRWKAVAYIYARAALGHTLQRPSLGLPADDRAALLGQLEKEAAA